jgi:hypothetical protein
MKDSGLVQGTEETGRMTPTYASKATLINIDVINSERTSARKVYATPDRADFTPITAIITRNASGLIWYAFQGPADGSGGRPSVQELITIVNLAAEVMVT